MNRVYWVALAGMTVLCAVVLLRHLAREGNLQVSFWSRQDDQVESDAQAAGKDGPPLRVAHLDDAAAGLATFGAAAPTAPAAASGPVLAQAGQVSESDVPADRMPANLPDQIESSTGTAIVSSPLDPRPGRKPPPAVSVSYVVQVDDSFSAIAARYYGAARHWVRIKQANPTVDPDRLRPGQIRTLPALEPAGDDQWYYTVKLGDTLTRIASRYFGTSAAWPQIYQANRPLIGVDPDKLAPGLTLKLPRFDDHGSN